MRPHRVLSFEAGVRKAGSEQALRRAAARLGMREFEDGGDAQVKQPYCYWGRLSLASVRYIRGDLCLMPASTKHSTD